VGKGAGQGTCIGTVNTIHGRYRNYSSSPYVESKSDAEAGCTQLMIKLTNKVFEAADKVEYVDI
jgi:hypothetical protein